MKKRLYITILGLIPFLVTNLHALKNKHFVLIIPSRNNSQWVERNLSSLKAQSYQYWHAIYLNDSSDDDTGQKVAQFIKENKLEDKIALINNETRQGALANIVKAVYMCDAWDIIVALDGDDWLNGSEVLTKLNEVYADDNVWMTYGSYEQFAAGKHQSPHFSKQTAIPKEVIASNRYRQHQWCSSHLRTFYTWLFKSISIDDLKLDGTFFPMAWDLAFMFPMLEMSGGKFKFISDILYIYNVQTPLNDHKVNRQLQAKMDKVIRSRPAYQPLKAVPANYLPRR